MTTTRTGDGGTQGGGGQQGQGNNEPDPTQGQGTQGDQGGAGEEEEEDRPLTGAEAKRLREEAARRRVSEREARKELDDLRAKQMSDTERAQKERDDAVKERDAAVGRVREANLRAAVLSAAADLGLRTPDRVARLIDRSEVEYDDDGEPTNIPKLLRAFAKDFPEFLEEGSGSNGADGGQGRRRQSTGNSINDQIRAMAGRG